MKKFSQIISAVFSPIIVPSYAVMLALWCSRLTYLPPIVKWHVILLVFCITAVVPLAGIICLKKLGVVSDTGLNKRTERTLPYVITGLAYAACAIYLLRANAPGWLWLFMAGATLATIISAVVNRWWKISAHMAAMGGLVAMMFRILDIGMAAPGVPFMLFTILIVIAAGAVGTARIYLDRHTLLQVIAGTANGFLCVFLLSAIH